MAAVYGLGQFSDTVFTWGAALKFHLEIHLLKGGPSQNGNRRMPILGTGILNNCHISDFPGYTV